MGTENRLRDLRGEVQGGVGEGLEEISQTYLRKCIANGHRQQCSEGQGWGWVEGDRGGKMGVNGGHL